MIYYLTPSFSNKKLLFEPAMQEIVRDLDISIKEKMVIIETDELPVLYGNKVRLRSKVTLPVNETGSVHA